MWFETDDFWKGLDWSITAASLINHRASGSTGCGLMRTISCKPISCKPIFRKQRRVLTMNPTLLLSVLWAGSVLVMSAAAKASGSQEQPNIRHERAVTIFEQVWHLGNDATPEWPEAPADPEAKSIEAEFTVHAFEGEGLLFARHRSVSQAWSMAINEHPIATLDLVDEYGWHSYPIPAGVIVDGVNTFSLRGAVPDDDITFGDVYYLPFGLRELYDLRRVTVRVTTAMGQPLPARVTISNEAGELVPVFYAERLLTAVRLGVVYTADGEATFEVSPGTYQVHAARGTEWSVDQTQIQIDGDAHEASLSLRRELDTRGFVAADTHIHTLTHSGHGDSSVEERMVTLAGEGVELAIATDHNHNTDYAPTQASMGLKAYFTPVIGNEVSTPIGHLNAFPLDSEDEVPPHDLHDIEEIVAGIRARGAKAVILNHPRWPSHENSPHGQIQLDHQSGDWTGAWACPFDALELINSQTEELDPLLLFRDWFALLNRGIEVFAVGSSDSHTVGGVVGQGRTYVLSDSINPARIDIDAAAHNIAHGHSSISMGIFVDMLADGRSVMGETLPATELDLVIRAPSWVRPRKITIFANGATILERELDPLREPGPLDITVPISTELPWPQHDYWMVALVEGDGVGGVFWPQLNDYTLAATNPVFCDVNGDGQYSDPRSLANELLATRGDTPADLAPLLREVDSSVAVQLLRLVRQRALKRVQADLEGLADDAAERHPGLAEWLRNQPVPK